MKLVKLFVLALCLTTISCSKDEPAILEDANLSFSVMQQLEYRGVLSTYDGKLQGKIFIEIPKGRTPIATVKLSTGDQLLIKGKYKESTKEELIIHFESNRMLFDLNVVDEPLEAQIENAVVDNKVTSIIAFKHTSRAPVVPIDGTYQCTDCGGSTFLNQGKQQTFNFVFVSDPSGNTNITTQVNLGTNMYTGGIGVQDNCVDNGDFRTCDIESGDGSTTTTGFMANGNPVTWTGTHTFNNLPADPLTDCSGVSGTWQWQSISFGLITGTFVSNDDCSETLAIQDFDGTTPTWSFSSDITFFNADGGTDQFGISDGTTGGSSGNVDFANITGNFLYVQDLNNPNGGTSGFATVTFADVNVAGRTNMSISFDYDVFEFDTGDDVEYILVLDGTDEPTVVLIDGLSNLSAEGTETIAVPNGTTTVGLKLRIRQNGAGDYAGFDNFTLVGF